MLLRVNVKQLPVGEQQNLFKPSAKLSFELKTSTFESELTAQCLKATAACFRLHKPLS